jgi:metal-responsive CopG/Arc/MetJ family transcriptional regulator
MDQKLFRELENIRGREKRSTFIEHLIILGLKTYRNKNEGFGIKHRKASSTVFYPMRFSETKQ